MSTKMRGLLFTVATPGTVKPRRVSHIEIFFIFRPIHSILLLRRTSEICIYYTDDHNVDESITAITNHGGHWSYASMTGAMIRHMNDIHTNTYIYVASSNMKN